MKFDGMNFAVYPRCVDTMDLQPVREEGRCPRIARCAFAVADWPWPFALQNADAITADWERRQAQIPRMFDGTIYLLRDHALVGEELTGTFFKTDFKTLLYWRHHRLAQTETVRECFGSSVIRSAEGHVLLGRQGPGQLNSGRIYPPSGLIDGEDVRAGCIDIEANILRELGEETGLAPQSLRRVPGYVVTFVGVQIAVGAEWRSALSAEELRAHMLDLIGRQSEPELDDIVIARTGADIDEHTMPAHACALLRSLLPA
jgi:8-oxo-dGTP pyrophosphatase MutT (NUDIX family)